MCLLLAKRQGNFFGKVSGLGFWGSQALCDEPLGHVSPDSSRTVAVPGILKRRFQTLLLRNGVGVGDEFLDEGGELLEGLKNEIVEDILRFSSTPTQTYRIVSVPPSKVLGGLLVATDSSLPQLVSAAILHGKLEVLGVLAPAASARHLGYASRPKRKET